MQGLDLTSVRAIHLYRWKRVAKVTAILPHDIGLITRSTFLTRVIKRLISISWTANIIDRLPALYSPVIRNKVVAPSAVHVRENTRRLFIYRDISDIKTINAHTH